MKRCIGCFFSGCRRFVGLRQEPNGESRGQRRPIGKTSGQHFSANFFGSEIRVHTASQPCLAGLPCSLRTGFGIDLHFLAQWDLRK